MPLAFKKGQTMEVETLIERIEADLGSICGDDEEETLLLKGFIIGYLRNRAGSLPVMMVLVNPDPIWMNEYVQLDLQAFYTEQKDIYFDDPEQICSFATVIVAPLVLGIFKETDSLSPNEVRVKSYLIPMQKATVYLQEMM
jgi:hypothetical protein